MKMMAGLRVVMVEFLVLFIVMEDPAAGLALTRDALSTNTRDNATDFFAAPPTPGLRAAPVPVSEPNVFGLILVAAWATLRRRPGRAD